MKNDEEFMKYFQDDYAEDKRPCREYFFNILNTLYPDYLAQIMQHSAKERFTAQGEDQQKQAIKVTDEWYEELQKMPFLSCK